MAAAPKPPIGRATLPKGAPNCIKRPEVAVIQKQNFALRIALYEIFLRFDPAVYFSFEIISKKGKCRGQPRAGAKGAQGGLAPLGAGPGLTPTLDP